MPTLVIHGGAGRIRAERQDAYRAGLAAALNAGFAVLDAGGSAVDAVCAAVRSMEDDPNAFNAGTGSALTEAGTVECDAAVMRSDGRAGAVACVSTSRNPVALARRVLDEGRHVLMVGRGAEALEPDPIDPRELVTEAARASLRRWRERRAAPEASATCGAVARDDAGRLAAATSTGGVLGQRPGRVGDAPIPGAGTWADPRVAISCTGRGEAFLQAATARALAADLEHGVDDRAAVQARLAEVRALHGEGGLIAVGADGRVLAGYDAPHMAWGWRRREGGAVADGWQVGDAPDVVVLPPATAG
jgi:beta-aspartyl-peptidase (threonine type)